MGDFVYTDEDDEVEDVDVDVENAYYNAKGLKESLSTRMEAVKAFEEVIRMENSYGVWSFKAMKQLVKLYIRVPGEGKNMMDAYKKLLECIASSTVTQNN